MGNTNNQKVSHSYPGETGNFDVDNYFNELYEDILNLAESSILHIWSPENLDHMRLPTNVNIHKFLAVDLRRLFFRWLLLIGINKSEPIEGIKPEDNRAFYKMMGMREYIIYEILLQTQLNGPTIQEIRTELGKLRSDERQSYIALLNQAESMYDSATPIQRNTWWQQYETEYEQYVSDNDFSAEKILYTPAYPDIILSNESGGTGITQDSPHSKVPPVISYKIRKSAPASTDRIPFGPNKEWKWREAGEFFDEKKEEVYRLRMRRWETLVEFSSVWRSGAEAETLCILFEQFMDLNERYFLEAGVEKVIPFGRTGEPDTRLDNAGVHYRKSLWYFRTQQFQYFGPVTRIDSVDVDVIPTTTTTSGQTNLG